MVLEEVNKCSISLFSNDSPMNECDSFDSLIFFLHTHNSNCFHDFPLLKVY